eukprot:jgi/Mesen1/4023/ME000212S03054
MEAGEGRRRHARMKMLSERKLGWSGGSYVLRTEAAAAHACTVSLPPLTSGSQPPRGRQQRRGLAGAVLLALARPWPRLPHDAEQLLDHAGAEARPGRGLGGRGGSLGAVDRPRLPRPLLPLVLQQQRAAAAGAAVPGARSLGPGLGSSARPRAAAGPCKSVVSGAGADRGSRDQGPPPLLLLPLWLQQQGQQQQQRRPLPSLALLRSPT